MLGEDVDHDVCTFASTAQSEANRHDLFADGSHGERGRARGELQRSGDSYGRIRSASQAALGS